MQRIEQYFKFIFTTLIAVVCFCCIPLVAHADPLTAAMIGSGAAMGFGFPGFAGLSPSSVGSAFDDLGFDEDDWESIPHRSVNVVENPNNPNNVDITLNQDITSAGNYRINQLNNIYGLTPGSVHTIGNFLAYNGYIFNKSIPNLPVNFIGASIGTASIGHYAIDSVVYFDVFESSNILKYNYNIGSYSYTNGVVPSVWLNQPIYFCVQTNYDPYRLCFAIKKTTNSWAYFPNEAVTGLSVSSSSPSVNRSQDSTLIQSQDYENKITIPKSYLNNISYTPGDISDVPTIEEILEQILAALTNDDILISILTPVSPIPTPTPPPEPTPVPGDTIANTPYSVLNDVFDDFKEVFGDISDGISEFQESFGDWVNDVSTGWTEIFGDIYDDLHEFKERFGDWVDDVASGWTEVFGDIYDTLAGWRESFGDFTDTITSAISDIVEAVEGIVESIKEGDFEFIDGFWKNFQAPFTPFFNTIKQHLGIWHYVVEWLSSISSAFTFFFGVMSNTGYSFVLPIYAAFAGTVVLAVYKRFGK